MMPGEITRSRDRLDAGRPGKPEIDLEPLLGSWVVFEAPSTGLTRVEIGEADGTVWARAYGSGSSGPTDWGPSPAQVFSDDVGGRATWGFRTSYDHGFQRVELFGYLNRALLVVDAATTFADGSGRSAYFTRKTFYRT